MKKSLDIFAHRGANLLAPENTMSAFRKAYQLGATKLELDVQLSKNKTLWIFHDDNLDRTTNSHGPLSEQTDAALAQLDAGQWFNAQFSGEKIPTLQKALAEFKDWGILINIEIKADNQQAKALVQAVIKGLAATHFPSDKILLSSFSREIIQLLSQEAPQYPRALNLDALDDDAVAFATETRCVSIHPLVTLLAQPLSESFLKEAHQAGLKVIPFVVNTQNLANALLGLETKIDGFFTDNHCLY